MESLKKDMEESRSRSDKGEATWSLSGFNLLDSVILPDPTFRLLISATGAAQSIYLSIRPLDSDLEM